MHQEELENYLEKEKGIRDQYNLDRKIGEDIQRRLNTIKSEIDALFKKFNQAHFHKDFENPSYSQSIHRICQDIQCIQVYLVDKRDSDIKRYKKIMIHDKIEEELNYARSDDMKVFNYHDFTD